MPRISDDGSLTDYRFKKQEYQWKKEGTRAPTQHGSLAVDIARS
jgi:hypothetical protein